MKTIKNILIVVLCGMMIPMLTSCSDKKTAGKADTASATANTETVMKVTVPPFQKFVVVTCEEGEQLYKEADTNSPTLSRWYEADCESDFCEMIYQWSDQPAREGFELDPYNIASTGNVYPVLDEKGDFYKVCVLNIWCDIESAYIPKASVGDIECAPIKADMLEAENNAVKYCVVKEGKYKDIVLEDNYDELDGESLHVGVLTEGVVATPVVYHVFCQMIPELEETTENMEIEESEGYFSLRYNKSLAVPLEEGYEAYQLDPKKLSPEQIAKIVDKVTTKKPEYVQYMYHIPAQGLQSFYFITK
ncbi:MAG: hypothetical protein IKH26_03110 [Bacteroidaceae bacterium]|nr:hypothetical protein [Bacteroidaceae bacterium]